MCELHNGFLFNSNEMKRIFIQCCHHIRIKPNDKDVDVFWYVKQQNILVKLSEIDFIRKYLQKAVAIQ